MEYGVTVTFEMNVTADNEEEARKKAVEVISESSWSTWPPTYYIEEIKS